MFMKELNMFEQCNLFVLIKIQELHYSCDLCDYTTSQKHSLKIRMYLIHEEEYHSGNMCDYKSTKKHLLKQHGNAIHEAVNFLLSLKRG